MPQFDPKTAPGEAVLAHVRDELLRDAGRLWAFGEDASSSRLSALSAAADVFTAIIGWGQDARLEKKSTPPWVKTQDDRKKFAARINERSDWARQLADQARAAMIKHGVDDAVAPSNIDESLNDTA